MRNTILFAIILFPALVGAAELPTSQSANLDEQLNALGTPGNQAPAGLTGEQLYAVQTRFSPLGARHELAIGAGNNFSTDGFLTSRSIDAAYRFYFTDRWFASLSGNYVFNEFTNGGQKLIDVLDKVADVGVTKYRGDLLIGHHLFYGKFRLSMDTVFYLDQYVALGSGIVVQDTGRRYAVVADVGLALWFGRNFAMHVGVKDYIFDEQRRLSRGWVNNFVGYLQAGYVFGG